MSKKIFFYMIVIIFCSCSGKDKHVLKIHSNDILNHFGKEHLYFDFRFNKASQGKMFEIVQALCGDKKPTIYDDEISIMLRKDNKGSIFCTHDPYRSMGFNYKLTKYADGYALNLENIRFDDFSSMPRKLNINGQEIVSSQMFKNWEIFLDAKNKTMEIIASYNSEQFKNIEIDYAKKAIICVNGAQKQTIPMSEVSTCSTLIYLKSRLSEESQKQIRFQ